MTFITPTSGQAGTQTHTYDERNRLTSGAGVDYTYTARGTLATETKDGAIRQLTFNAFDQLVNDGELAYTCDALGRLTSRAKAGATQHFAYSGLANDVAAVTDNAGAVQSKYGRDLAGGVLGVLEGAGAAVSAVTDLHGDLVCSAHRSMGIRVPSRITYASLSAWARSRASCRSGV
ncbi:hypothetical protein AB0B45_49860 [Nonomuraea sp. NPDC049152]|uniref:hypothetical protein n=1 Tax=Nonomuraea sp. NPDC049152 TaxID=3154350 RepID=UPI0033DFDF40